MDIKPIVFVRFPPGGCGLFLSMILQMLVENFKLDTGHSGHASTQKYYQYHNFVDHWTKDRLVVKEFTSIDSDPLVGVDWVKQHFKVYENPYPYYIVPTHVINLDAFTIAFPNSKVVNITFDEINIDQLCYNMAYKSMIEDSNIDVVSRCVRKFKSIYPDVVINPRCYRNPLFMAFTFKLMHLDHFKDMLTYNKTNQRGSFNIMFADIFTGQSNWLNELSEFLGVEFFASPRQLIAETVKDYGTLQQIVPVIPNLEEILDQVDK